MKYYSFNPYLGAYGFELHDTAESAKKRAESSILELRNDDGSYDVDVEDVSWGKVIERAIPIKLKDETDTDTDTDTDTYDNWIYGLKSVD